MTRYGLIFLGLGLSVAALALRLDGAALALLAWTALGFAIIALAYFTERPALLGKRPDGSIAPWTLVCGMPVMLLNHGVHWLIRPRDEPPCDEVAPGIHVGGLPTLQTLPTDIATIVDLTSEFIAQPQVRCLPGYLSYPMLDDGFVGPDELEAIVRELDARPGPVLIHCGSGHGRSSTLAAALGIVRGHFASPEDAEIQMRRVRPRIGYKAVQRERLGQWFARYHGGG